MAFYQADNKAATFSSPHPSPHSSTGTSTPQRNALRVTLSGTSQNAARFFGHGRDEVGLGASPARGIAAGEKLPALPSQVGRGASPYAQPIAFAGSGTRARSAAGTNRVVRSSPLGRSALQMDGLVTASEVDAAYNADLASAPSGHIHNGIASSGPINRSGDRVHAEARHAQAQESEIKLRAPMARQASNGTLGHGQSQTLLRKAVFGDSKARQVAADVMRIHVALDKALVAAEVETTASLPEDHSPDDVQAQISVAQLRTYASALVTMIGAPGVAKVLPEVVRDLCVRLATGVNDAADAVDIHMAATRRESIRAIEEARHAIPVQTAVPSQHAAPKVAISPKNARLLLHPITRDDAKAAHTEGASHTASMAPLLRTESDTVPTVKPSIDVSKSSGPASRVIPPLASSTAPSPPYEGVNQSELDEEDYDDDDGFAEYAMQDDRGGDTHHIASVVREANSSTATPARPTLTSPSLKSPIPKLGLSSNPSQSPAPEGLASFQEEFMSNQDEWSESWREEASSTVKTSTLHGAPAVVRALQLAQSTS